jgi:hypothetical protein
MGRGGPCLRTIFVVAAASTGRRSAMAITDQSQGRDPRPAGDRPTHHGDRPTHHGGRRRPGPSCRGGRTTLDRPGRAGSGNPAAETQERSVGHRARLGPMTGRRPKVGLACEAGLSRKVCAPRLGNRVGNVAVHGFGSSGCGDAVLPTCFVTEMLDRIAGAGYPPKSGSWSHLWRSGSTAPSAAPGTHHSLLRELKGALIGTRGCQISRRVAQ